MVRRGGLRPPGLQRMVCALLQLGLDPSAAALAPDLQVAARRASHHHLPGAAFTTDTCRRLVHTARAFTLLLDAFRVFSCVNCNCHMIRGDASLPCVLSMPGTQTASRSCGSACQLRCPAVSVSRLQAAVAAALAVYSDKDWRAQLPALAAAIITIGPSHRCCAALHPPVPHCGSVVWRAAPQSRRLTQQKDLES